MVQTIRQRMEGLEEPQISCLAPEPFKHQVGGCTAFFSLPNGHLLKPCDERELLFYKKMPRALLPIAPRCCTTIENRSSCSLPQCCSTCAGNPKDTLALTEELVKPGKANGNRRTISRNFLVMSDLTRGFERPCVLDLKLGTRQHRDDAPPEKVISQSLKCAATTSSGLGIRLCGMQYWTPEGENIYLSKMDGRSLSPDSLVEALNDFFSCSTATENVLSQVKKIKEVLSSLDGVRLFGASILIVVEAAYSQAEVRLVDFANASLPGLFGGDGYIGPDEGSIKGLTTIENILNDILSHH